ncbi:MAG: RNA polymerase sigma factor RpoH [Pseudomonadota bacterium]
MTTALSATLAVPTGDLDAYKRAVLQFPMLEAEQEKDLARRLRDQDDLDAAWELVTSHLRFVVKVARGYAGYGLAQGDLIQEGNVGLMKAVRRFDPEMGVRLVSFAVHWIKAEIHEYILRNWRVVKVATTKAQRKLFFNLRGAKQALGWMSREEAADIAEDLGVTPDDVVEMEQRLSARDATFDAPLDDDEAYAPAAYLEDHRYEPAALVEADDWEANARERVAEGLQQLDARSRDIVQRRWVDEPKATLHELADEYGVSAERIRQIEAAAMKKLRKLFD